MTSRKKNSPDSSKKSQSGTEFQAGPVNKADAGLDTVIEGVAHERGAQHHDSQQENVDGHDGSDGTSNKPKGGLVNNGSSKKILPGAALALALAAIALSAAGYLLQGQRVDANRSALAALTASTGALDARVADLETSVAADRDLLTGFADDFGQLKQVLPSNPGTVIAALDERLALLDARLSGLENMIASDAVNLEAVTNSDTALLTIQAGLSVITAMTAENLQGRNLTKWLPVLQDLQAAGGDIGSGDIFAQDDLAALTALIQARPPSTMALLTDAQTMIFKRIAEDTSSNNSSDLGNSGNSGNSRNADDIDDASSGAGWLAAITNRLANFVNLRPVDPISPDDASLETPPIAANGSPSPKLTTAPADFIAAIRDGDLAAAMTNVPSDDAPAAASWNLWRVQAGQRLALDAQLAALTSSLTSVLTSALSSTISKNQSVQPESTQPAGGDS